MNVEDDQSWKGSEQVKAVERMVEAMRTPLVGGKAEYRGQLQQLVEHFTSLGFDTKGAQERAEETLAAYSDASRDKLAKWFAEQSRRKLVFKASNGMSLPVELLSFFDEDGKPNDKLELALYIEGLTGGLVFAEIALLLIESAMTGDDVATVSERRAKAARDDAAEAERQCEEEKKIFELRAQRTSPGFVLKTMRALDVLDEFANPVVLDGIEAALMPEQMWTRRRKMLIAKKTHEDRERVIALERVRAIMGTTQASEDEVRAAEAVLSLKTEIERRKSGAPTFRSLPKPEIDPLDEIVKGLANVGIAAHVAPDSTVGRRVVVDAVPDTPEAQRTIGLRHSDTQ